MKNSTIRLRRALPALAMAGLLAGCNDVLDVQRPTVITPENVGSDPLMIQAMVAGAQGPFRTAYATTAAHGASQTDEAIFSHSWSPWNEYDDRNVTSAGGAYDGITYPQLQQARAAGARMVTLLRGALGEQGAATSAGFASANAYAGYSHLLIADHLCAIPIDGSAPKTPDEVRDIAIGFFQEAVKVGTAANAADIVNLANVGLARAYLGKGDKANALTYAKKVPADFAAYVRYTSDPDFGQWTIYNLYNRVSGLRSPSEFNLGYEPADSAMHDLRVPFERDSLHRMFDVRGNRYAYVPYVPSSFTGWTPGNKKMIPDDAGIRFASGLEARYMIAEAGGMSPGELRAFVDERRAVGGLAPFAGTDAQLQDEVMEQRRMDFMLAGFRMPDLIRYKRFYSKDFWPKGQMPGWVTGDYKQSYGTTECWPIGASEKNANPNVP